MKKPPPQIIRLLDNREELWPLPAREYSTPNTNTQSRHPASLQITPTTGGEAAKREGELEVRLAPASQTTKKGVRTFFGGTAKFGNHTMGVY